MPNSPSINFAIWLVFVAKSTINIIIVINKNIMNKMNNNNNNNDALFIFFISTCELLISLSAKIVLNLE